TVEAKPEITPDSIADALLAAALEEPGASWRKIRDLKDEHGGRRVRGHDEEVAAVRDRLIAEGRLINSAAVSGRFNLWHPDDPTPPVSNPGTAQEPLAFPPAAARRSGSGSVVPPKGEPLTEPPPRRAADPYPPAGLERW